MSSSGVIVRPSCLSQVALYRGLGRRNRQRSDSLVRLPNLVKNLSNSALKQTGERRRAGNADVFAAFDRAAHYARVLVAAPGLPAKRHLSEQ
jgi:hypothetical protein